MEQKPVASSGAGVPAKSKVGVVKAESTQETPKDRATRLVPMDISNEELLKWDDEAELVWDPSKMRELPEDVLREMSYENRRSYFISFGQGANARRQNALASAADPTKPPQLWVEDPFAQMARRESRMLRPRKGWHQTWIRDDQVEDFFSINWNGMGYRYVRSQNKEKDPQPVGEESGEIIKLTERFSSGREITKYQVECPEELYEHSKKAMSYRSTVSTSNDAMKTLAATLEVDVNSKMKHRGERVSVVSEVTHGAEVFSLEGVEK